MFWLATAGLPRGAVPGTSRFDARSPARVRNRLPLSQHRTSLPAGKRNTHSSIYRSLNPERPRAVSRPLPNPCQLDCRPPKAGNRCANIFKSLRMTRRRSNWTGKRGVKQASRGPIEHQPRSRERPSPSHGENRGSIPLGSAKEIKNLEGTTQGRVQFVSGPRFGSARTNANDDELSPLRPLPLKPSWPQSFQAHGTR
jgi:hypothetical protein